MELLLTDVTLRDGLQMEALLPTEKKILLFEKLLATGYERLEVTSFVNPKWVPQFQDADEFCRRAFKGKVSKETMAFVPNEKGLERMLPFPIQWVGCFVAASATFNKKNVNESIEETSETLKRVVEKARASKRKVRVYVSTVFGCPYEGPIQESHLQNVLKRIVDLGPDEIALSDTIGVATPADVSRVLDSFLKIWKKESTALHFHNTYGLALACLSKAHEFGVRKFDGSSGGVGGCPYAKGATGNVALEDVAYLFHREKKYDGFKKAAVEEVIQTLHRDLNLKIASSLGQLFLKGAGIYGVQ